MTKAEILKQIEELKKQVENLPEDEKKIRTLPIEDEKYTYINTDHLIVYANTYPEVFDYSYAGDKENSSIGNYFKTAEDAKMVIRAMKIEQAIRIRRIELNDGWEPDWKDTDEVKYRITFNHYTGGDNYVSSTYDYDCFPIFGYYKTYEIARQIIDEFKDELEWYLKEYYPNKDRMYVWGD